MNSDDFSRGIGERLRIARQKKFPNSAACAAAMGISPSTWSNYEGGVKKITAERMVKLAEFFGCDAGWLLTGVEPGGGREVPAAPAQTGESADLLAARNLIAAQQQTIDAQAQTIEALKALVELKKSTM